MANTIEQKQCICEITDSLIRQEHPKLGNEYIVCQIHGATGENIELAWRYTLNG